MDVTQEELASMIGVSRSTMIAVENKKRMAFVLCCSQARWDKEGKLKELSPEDDKDFRVPLSNAYHTKIETNQMP